MVLVRENGSRNCKQWSEIKNEIINLKVHNVTTADEVSVICLSLT